MTLRIRAAGPDELETVVDVEDDSFTLYAVHEVHLDLTPSHPFCVAERVRWARSVARGDTRIAELDGVPVGIAVLGWIDGEPYLDQLSVRRRAMRRGVGRALVEASIVWAGTQPLWLTTYAHLPFNRPFYESMGFERVEERRWPPEIAAVIATQRACLAHPDERCVMRHAPRGG